MNRSAFIASSCAVFAAGPVSAQTSTPVLRVGANLFDSFASSLYANDMGFFTRNGLNAEVRVVGNGAAEAAAVAAGSLDIGISTPDRIASAYEHGIPFVIIAEGQLSTDKVRDNALCVAQSSPIRTPKDLEGKTVATNSIGGMTQLGIDAWLAKGGADFSKVKFFELNYNEMGPSLDRGTIQAAIISEPALTQALRQNAIRVLANPDSSIGPQFPNSVWFAQREFAQKNGDAVSRFCRAIYAAQQWANTHLSERATILAKYTKIDINVAHALVYSPFAERLNIADIQPIFDLAAKFQTIPRPLAATEVVFQSP